MLKTATRRLHLGLSVVCVLSMVSCDSATRPPAHGDPTVIKAGPPAAAKGLRKIPQATQGPGVLKTK
jgi:hypothetical protein